MPRKPTPKLTAAQRRALRDKFAMAALQGLLADPNVAPEDNESVAHWRAKTAHNCYTIADAMLGARDA